MKKKEELYIKNLNDNLFYDKYSEISKKKKILSQKENI